MKYLKHITVLKKSDSDYYAFGMVMPERSYSGSAYKYGYNGKEKDDQINVDGGDYDFGASIFNSRLGKFLSLDPKVKDAPEVSTYAFAHDMPIIAIDLNGEKTYFIGGSGFNPFKIKNDFSGHLIRDLRAILGNDDFHVVQNSRYNKPIPAVSGGKWSGEYASTVLKVEDYEVLKATRDEILADFKAAKDKGGNEPLNIIASSYGTVVAAQVVIDMLAKDPDLKIDNLILSNSMINRDPKNPLFAELLRLQNEGRLKFEFQDTNGDNVKNSGGNNQKEGRKNFNRIKYGLLLGSL